MASTKASLIRNRYNLPEGVPTRSPWGPVQHGEVLGQGVVSVSTAGHGGIKVHARINRRIPEVFRRSDGWYEEDVDWAVPAHFLPEFFSVKQREHARKILRSWRYKSWEAHYGEDIPLDESPCKASDLFLLEHANDFLTVAAWGDWHGTIPEGMVGVCASRGGSRQEGRETRYYLVSKDEYRRRSENPSGSMVIDEARHQTWDRHP